MKKYGIFGGTFNPPHIGHSILADYVREELLLDKIIFIPSGNPPLKDSISTEHRLNMSKLAFGNDENFEISEIESENIEKKTYTVDTLQKLNEKYKDEDVQLYLIIGMDKLNELPKWKEPEKLFKLAKVIVINRPDNSVSNAKPEFRERAEVINTPELEISSSEIRKRIYENKSVKYLLNEKVLEYIKKNNLYIKP